MARLPTQSKERDAMAAALYGASETLNLDSESHIVLTDPLKRHAGIGSMAMFVGLGHRMQIWEPDRFCTQLAEATEMVRALKERLGHQMAAPRASGARE